MLHVQKITSLDLPELEPYRTLRRQAEHRAQKIFVAEGEKTLRRLLQTPLLLVSILLTPEWFQIFEPLLKNRLEDIQIYVTEKPVLEALTGFKMFQGLLVVAKMPTPPTLEEILQRSPKPNLFVAVDRVDNADNLGTLVRNCAAFSVHAFFASLNSSSPFLRRAVRSSMGGIFKIPILEELDLVATLQELKQHGVRCVAAHPLDNGKILPEANLKNDCCIVFGNEARGISEGVLAVCDDLVSIPMPPSVNSMNVSNAGAVFLYEAQRQRKFANRVT